MKQLLSIVESLPAWAPLLVGLWGLACAARSRKQILGTTLMGPWLWTVGSILAVSLAASVAQLISEVPAAALRQSAAVSTLCPAMSLLGAKRPQDRGWHFVVGALWSVLMLPILEGVLSGGPDIAGLRSLFVGALVLLGLINALPTRFWLPALFWQLRN